MGYLANALLWYDLAKRVKRFIWDNESNHDYGATDPYLQPAEKLSEADLYTSKIAEPVQFGDHTETGHLIALDIDITTLLMPSSTPGHSHLIIDKVLTWSDYSELLNHLAKLGIIEEGYNEIAQKRKRTDLRVPWLSKDSSQSGSQKLFQESIRLYEQKEEADGRDEPAPADS